MAAARHLLCLLLALPMLIALGGCSGFGIYKLDIQQGNLVTQEQLAKVKLGMSRLDVRNALGTPLLSDPFHADRWDYYFSDERGSKYGPFGRETQKYHVTIVFESEKVTRIEGQASPVEVLTGGGERRALPKAVPPNAPPTPPKS